MAKADRKLNIKVGMDRSAYKQEAERHKQEEKQNLRELLTQEEVNERAKQLLVADTNRKRIAEAKQAKDSEGKGWLDTSKAVESATGSVSGYLTGLATLSTAAGIVKQVAEYWDGLHRQTVSAAMELTGYRGKLLELAALKDQMGSTGPELASQVRFRAQTLQTRDAAVQMQAAALGIGEVAIDKPGRPGKITGDEFQKLLVAAGKMQTLEGGSPEAYGTLAGLIPMLSKGKITGAQGEQKMSKLFAIQQPGGFKNFTEAIGQFQKLTGYIQTGQLSDEDAMGFLSAFSSVNRESAGTLTEQSIRAVSANVLRSKGMKLDSTQDQTKTNEFFKGIGVTTKMPIKERMLTTAKALAGEMKAHPEMVLSDYLVSRGFGSQEERNALSIMAGMEKEGQLASFLSAGDKAGEPGAITKGFEGKVAKDPFLQTQRAGLMEEMARMGKGVQMEGILPIQQAAWATLKASGAITDEKFEDWANRGMLGRASDDALFGGYHSQVNTMAQASVVGEARRLGLKGIPSTGYYSQAEQREVSTYMGDEELSSLTRRVQEAGGNPAAGFADVVKGMADRLGNAISPVPHPMQGTPPQVQGNRP